MIERGVALTRALQDSPVRQVVVQPAPQQQQQQRGSGHRAVPAVADALRTAVAELAAISGVGAPPPQTVQPPPQGQAVPAPAVASAGGTTSQPLPPPQKQAGKGTTKKGTGAK